MELDNLENWRKSHYANEITPKSDGKKVVLMGWMREIRLHGKLAFIVLADRSGDCQITIKEEENSKFFEKIRSLNREDVIAVKGTVKKTKQTVRGVEVLLSDFKLLNRAQTPLPLDVAEKTPALFDTRLDNRVLDLRKPKVLVIFKIRGEILRAAREYFAKNNFMEIETPKIIATATEGGAELFPVSYFDKAAFLRQSPQLYKELMTACFEKVFEIGPIFRAEPSETTRHIAEVTQMDIEIGFATEEDTWEVFDDLIPYIYSSVKKNCADELKILSADLKVPKAPFKRISYTDTIKE
ncbi:TPA: aspartate--tRNA(Asn) ligase, partial [archaeon]|nr:aspartate--tRNA(Asn) ligase [Candidatus Naiadarchaeales archaeon SRR2090153.bin1042]